MSKKTKYTTQQMVRSQIADLIVDYRCALRDAPLHGQRMIDYGNACKLRAVQLFKNRRNATVGRFGQVEI